MIIGQVTGEINVDGQPPLLFEKELTREYLGMSRDAFTDLVGDGNGRISVTMNRKDMDFGTGFGASVTTSLTCDQSAEGLEDGFMLAKGLTLQYLDDAYGEIEDTFQKDKKPKKGRGRGR